MEFHSYPDREMMMLRLAQRISSELGETLRSSGRASLSVPGGTTPGPVFDTLSGAELDWANVAVMLNDERWVSEDSQRSNTRLLRERLLTGRAAAATLVPLYADAPTPEDAIDDLAEGVSAHLPISVLLLGMGADMHTASLFPGADNLEQALRNDAPPLMAMRANAAGEPRITLTAPVLKSALRVHILITGAEKRAALEKAAKLPPLEAPVACILDQAQVHWAE
ncbi:6-phosphogluconolactonase [Roseinatronobacter alkalisoli]|uniref:6-phosphogluconolactonase n=1 Tax=Roseinatronobacter alkalisoli TaxID=3028235 RepID=A0ABT5T981_9RHOB|nr:6-phosphogluconolactonase [Roseinatronobacter sp. HJB301]MDD7971678.1 6-phosphogluconolactonase [Roseinatronobacter sp. HJB301]